MNDRIGGERHRSAISTASASPGSPFALAAGVPLELVQRVTGHRTVEVVMKHYFRPGREDFRAAILRAMPKMLANGGQQSAKEQLREILEGTTTKTWSKNKATVLRLLAAL